MTNKTHQYYLLSVYHTKAEDQHFFFWRPENAGYTRNLTEAGIYTSLPSKKSDTFYQPNGYHNTLRTLPVDKNSDLFFKLQKEQDGKVTRILNNEYNCHLLGITSDGRNLKRGIS
jgi:hypothetical protein